MRRRSPRSHLKGKRYRLARQKTLALHEARTGRPWSDRYVVTCLDGWEVRPEAGRGQHRKPLPLWYVHDSAYCGRVVATFRSTVDDDGRLLAERFAAKLNRLDWEAER
jgi:hypothetical protein